LREAVEESRFIEIVMRSAKFGAVREHHRELIGTPHVIAVT
jgi:hypothetical protein